LSKKPISLWQATAIGLGNIIGAGIFVLAGTVINQAGPGAVLSFLLTAILAITVALNSAELASKIVSHGGLYSFAKETMGEAMGFVVGWLRAISYAIATSAVSLGFSSYLLTMVDLYSIHLEIVLAIGLMSFAVFFELCWYKSCSRNRGTFGWFDDGWTFDIYYHCFYLWKVGSQQVHTFGSIWTL